MNERATWRLALVATLGLAASSALAHKNLYIYNGCAVPVNVEVAYETMAGPDHSHRRPYRVLFKELVINPGEEISSRRATPKRLVWVRAGFMDSKPKGACHTGWTGEQVRKPLLDAHLYLETEAPAGRRLRRSCWVTYIDTWASVDFDFCRDAGGRVDGDVLVPSGQSGRDQLGNCQQRRCKE